MKVILLNINYDILTDKIKMWKNSVISFSQIFQLVFFYLSLSEISQDSSQDSSLNVIFYLSWCETQDSFCQIFYIQFLLLLFLVRILFVVLQMLYVKQYSILFLCNLHMHIYNYYFLYLTNKNHFQVEMVYYKHVLLYKDKNFANSLLYDLTYD